MTRLPRLAARVKTVTSPVTTRHRRSRPPLRLSRLGAWPTGLVRIRHQRRGQRRLRRGHGCHQRGGRLLAQRRHAARGEGRIQQRATPVGRGALAQVVLPAQHRHGRLHPRPERPGGHVRGQRRAGALATRGAHHPVQPMLGDHGAHGWQLGDLVRHEPLTRPVCRHRGRAVDTGGRSVVDDVVHPRRRDHGSLVGHVPRLPATHPPARRRRRATRRLRRVRRRRARRIAGVLAHLRPQLAHLVPQRRHLAQSRHQRHNERLRCRRRRRPHLGREHWLPLRPAGDVHADQNAPPRPAVSSRYPGATP